MKEVLARMSARESERAALRRGFTCSRHFGITLGLGLASATLCRTPSREKGIAAVKDDAEEPKDLLHRFILYYSRRECTLPLVLRAVLVA